MKEELIKIIVDNANILISSGVTILIAWVKRKIDIRKWKKQGRLIDIKEFQKNGSYK